MKEQEKIFVHELEIFRSEIESAIQFFYTYLTINDCLSENEQALRIINRTPLFWRTIVGSLQTSFFIALGRIFDQNSKHNIDRLLRIAQDNMEIFSEKSLELRKIENSENADEWIDEYMKDVYVPTAQDFRRLRKHVAKYRKIYVRRYRDIRRKIYAHRELSREEELQSLFKNTDVREIQKLLIFLNKLYQCLWRLFHNGRKPILRPMRYSAEAMRHTKTPEWQSKHVQEHIVHETENFFRILSSVTGK